MNEQTRDYEADYQAMQASLQTDIQKLQQALDLVKGLNGVAGSQIAELVGMLGRAIALHEYQYEQNKHHYLTMQKP